MSPTLNEFLSGIKAETPLLVGVIPFGMIYGVLSIASGLAPVEAQAMSAIVFAGSAQFITTQLVSAGAPGLVIVLTVAVVNLRHVLYSASVAPYLQKLAVSWKLLLSYLLTDEAYAVTIVHFSDTPTVHRHWFYLGAGLTLWTSWQLSTLAGIFLGAVIPESWSLDFTLPLIFIALVAPRINSRSSLGSALSAGVVAVAAYELPYKLGLVMAALVGIGVGLLLEREG